MYQWTHRPLHKNLLHARFENIWSSCGLWNCLNHWTIPYTPGICSGVRLSGFSGVFWDHLTDWIVFVTHHICKENHPLWIPMCVSRLVVNWRYIHLCGSESVFRADVTAWTVSHKLYICRDIHLCGFACVFWDAVTVWTVFRTLHICRDIHLCGSSCVFWDWLTAWTVSHIPHICRDIHLYGISCVLWDCLTP